MREFGKCARVDHRSDIDWLKPAIPNGRCREMLVLQFTPVISHRDSVDRVEVAFITHMQAVGSPSSAPNTLVKSATLSFGTATARAGIGTGLLRDSFPACMVGCFLPSHSSTHDLTRWLPDPAAVRALRDAVFASLSSVMIPALPVADRVARRWLARSPSPYLGELDAIAAHTRIFGIYAINLSYEYSCTTLARADAPGLTPTLRRTLDWPFLGLGRAIIVAHRSGPAGEFYDATWPGAVGTLTAVAPGRFAAAINQAPLLRRTRTNMLRPVDYARNLVRTLSRERGMPPLHLLRHVFETATSFAQGLELLKTVGLARPVLFTLVGCASDEIAAIERRERDATVHLGPGSVANDWREPQGGWEPRPCAARPPAR